MLKKKKKKFLFFPFLDRLSTNTKTLKASADKFRHVVLDFVTKTISEEIYVSFLNNILVSTLDFILVRWRQKKKLDLMIHQIFTSSNPTMLVPIEAFLQIGQLAGASANHGTALRLSVSAQVHLMINVCFHGNSLWSSSKTSSASAFLHGEYFQRKTK